MVRPFSPVRVNLPSTEDVAGGELHAGLDGQDVRGDVVVDGADEVLAVHAALDVLEDGLQLAHDVLLTQRQELALGRPTG
jgi:hypothetical protein